MDLLQEINKRIEALGASAVRDGLAAIVQHIEVAERHLANARREAREEYFNDVLYRTNQAYEGMLREAYTVLVGKPPSNLSTHGIEQFLLRQGILSERAIDLLKNYRQNWRNPSTHDHRLVFRDHEAVLAIVSVSSFAVVLLERVIGAASFAEAEKEGKKPVPLPPATKHKPLADRLAQLVRQFGTAYVTADFVRAPYFESQLLGQLRAFIAAAEPALSATPEASIGGKSGIKADMLIQDGDETVLLELKRRIATEDSFESALSQVTHYLAKAGLKDGILFAPPWTLGEDLTINEVAREQDGNSVRILAVLPPLARGRRQSGPSAA